MSLPSTPGLYIEIGLILGAVHTAWVAWWSFHIGARQGRRTAHAARSLQNARIIRAEAQQALHARATQEGNPPYVSSADTPTVVAAVRPSFPSAATYKSARAWRHPKRLPD